MPDERLFDKHENSGDIMNEIFTGEKDWIRLLYVYETDDILLVKYYIKKDFYLSYWNKNTKKIVNTKAKSIIVILTISSLIIGGFVWTYSVLQTGGMIENRYANKDARGREKFDKLGGREEIANTELIMFLENFL